jgi:DNA-binding transcriptional LysR family regulator
MLRSDWLDAFLVFSKEMNFTKAAEKLNLSQPALHTKISKLGEWLEVPLYYKVGRNLALTPQGERVAAYAREQQERSGSFVDTLRSGSTDQPVVLCAGEGAYAYLLGPALSAFTKKNRQKLRLLTGDQDRTFEALLSGEAHIGVSAPDTLPSRVKGEFLTEVGQVLVMPRNHPLAQKKKLELKHLNNQDLVAPPNPRPHRVMINRMLMDANVTWRVAVEASGWDLMMQFVHLGLGLAIVNGFCRPGAGLVAKPLRQLPRIRYQILTPKHRPQNANTSALRERLMAHRHDWRTDVE